MSMSPEEFGRTIQILNTSCTETTYAALCEDLTDYCAEPEELALAVDFTNVHIVAMREYEEGFRGVTEAMDLFIPDSTVLTWAVNWRGGRMPDRVYGPAFLAYMIAHTPKHLRHYFLGASQDCLDKLLEKIGEQNPDFQVVGSHNGYFGPEDEEGLLEDINAAKADLVWVGLGTPKQQEWIQRFKDRAKAGALLAVGFAFDVNAGTKRDAPMWMQRVGMTWLYRLSEEPRRLWKRYLVYNSLFLQGLAVQRLKEGPPPKQKRNEFLPDLLERAVGAEPVEDGPPRCNVLGVGISVMDLEMATDLVIEGAEVPEKSGYVTVTGVHGVMESRRDPDLQKIHNRSFLSTPDGMPMVWIGKWMGFDHMGRVYGPDLLLAVADQTSGSGHRHFFFGGGEGVADTLAERLKHWFSDLNVVGTYTPPFREMTEEEDLELVAELQKARPHFVWVGLGTPKQERFMHGFLERYPDITKGWGHGLILLGVGAAFDFHSGRIHQAPRWMQRKGLEWFFRLCMEPRRLWKRYSINNSGFIVSIVPQLMGLKSHRMKK